MGEDELHRASEYSERIINFIENQVLQIVCLHGSLGACLQRYGIACYPLEPRRFEVVRRGLF